MTKMYHVKLAHNKEEINFITLDEVHELAQNGTITPYDHIKGEGNKTWHKASTVKGLTFKEDKVQEVKRHTVFSKNAYPSKPNIDLKSNTIHNNSIKNFISNKIIFIAGGISVFTIVVVLLATKNRDNSIKPQSESEVVQRRTNQTGQVSQTFLDALRTKQEAEEKEKEAEEKEKLRLATLHIDKSWTRIPEGFEGHDSKLLYESLVSKLEGLFYKSRFDTQAIHDNKIRDAVQGEILGHLEIHDTLAFMTSVYAYYDAESEAFSWHIDDDVQLKNLKRETEPLSKYRPSLAGWTEFYNVEVKYKEDLKLKLENSISVVTLQMNPQLAEQRERQLEVMLLGTIQFPYIDKGGNDIRLMTIGDVLEQTKYDDTVESDVVYTLPFRVSEIWVIRSDTGEVLLKEKQ